MFTANLFPFFGVGSGIVNKSSVKVGGGREAGNGGKGGEHLIPMKIFKIGKVTKVFLFVCFLRKTYPLPLNVFGVRGEERVAFWCR